MKIINIGDRIMNTYVYPLKEGYAMIDTGYPKSMKNCGKRLAKHGLSWTDIRYVFLTHAHDDHAGFLNELIGKYPHIRVILNPAGMPVLRWGQNSFKGGCSTFGAYVFCRMMALWGKGKHLFPPLEEKYDDRLLFISEENMKEAEELLEGKILFTPGHTGDSVSLQVGDIIFCGDAAMNGYPSSHRITIWVEERRDFRASWDVLLAQKAEMIYPAHGRPFPPADLEKYKDQVMKTRVYPLQAQ